MGFIFSKMFGKLFGQKDIRILILGLDNAGKTTILNKLHLNDVVQTIPTIGFNVETVTFKNLKFQVWDLGGQSGIRPYWRSYYPNTNGVIYVVDSVDKDRLDTTKQELLSMIQEEELKQVPLMVLANKQDLAGALSEEKISEFMGLTNIQDRQWSIFKCSAFTGHGLNEGMEWLVNILESQK